MYNHNDIEFFDSFLLRHGYYDEDIDNMIISKTGLRLFLQILLDNVDVKDLSPLQAGIEIINDVKNNKYKFKDETKIKII